MKIFDFDRAAYREEFAAAGWVHIPEGVSEAFHRVLVDYAREELTDHLMEGFAIKGKKEQSLFEFPGGMDPYPELFDVVAEVCGLNRSTMTLSERHIQAYEANAAPEPPAHKDRFPSQVSVGLSITIPAESRLVLYPYEDRELNPFNTSAGLRQSLQPDELPEVVLKTAQEVELDDQDRDVVMFPGSTTWHLRRRAARSINLYLKFNDFDCDPLGEDPTTGERRSRSLEALGGATEAEWAGLVPVLARRMDTIARRLTRDGWREVLEAQVFGEPPFGITRRQFDALRAADGRRSLAELIGSVEGDGGEGARGEVLRLVELGALDLLQPSESSDGGGPVGSADVASRGG